MDPFLNARQRQIVEREMPKARHNSVSQFALIVDCGARLVLSTGSVGNAAGSYSGEELRSCSVKRQAPVCNWFPCSEGVLSVNAPRFGSGERISPRPFYGSGAHGVVCSAAIIGLTVRAPARLDPGRSAHPTTSHQNGGSVISSIHWRSSSTRYSLMDETRTTLRVGLMCRRKVSADTPSSSAARDARTVMGWCRSSLGSEKYNALLR